MTLRSKARFGAVTFIAMLLATLAAGAPLINSVAGPPRAVFLQLPEDVPEPKVSLTAYQAAPGHWRLEIDAAQFQFSDLCVPDAAAIPVGHAHVIQNGVKVASAYQPVIDLGNLPPGSHRIAVVLRGQDHRALVGQTGLISAELVVFVPRASV